MFNLIFKNFLNTNLKYFSSTPNNNDKPQYSLKDDSLIEFIDEDELEDDAQDTTVVPQELQDVTPGKQSVQEILDSYAKKYGNLCRSKPYVQPEKKPEISNYKPRYNKFNNQGNKPFQNNFNRPFNPSYKKPYQQNYKTQNNQNNSQNRPFNPNHKPYFNTNNKKPWQKQPYGNRPFNPNYKPWKKGPYNRFNKRFNNWKNYQPIQKPKLQKFFNPILNRTEYRLKGLYCIKPFKRTKFIKKYIKKYSRRNNPQRIIFRAMNALTRVKKLKINQNNSFQSRLPTHIKYLLSTTRKSVGLNVTSLLKRRIKLKHSTVWSRKALENTLIRRKAPRFANFQTVHWKRLRDWEFEGHTLRFETRREFWMKQLQKKERYWRTYKFPLIKSYATLLNRKKRIPILRAFAFKKWHDDTVKIMNNLRWHINRNRKEIWKKPWHRQKAIIKNKNYNKFLYKNSKFQSLRKQDTFRLLHDFRTKALHTRYIYKGQYLLESFNKLKQKHSISNISSNASDRFLWHLERTVNILFVRAKLIPSAKISTHLVRYGFFLVNNISYNNPYTRVNLLDILRVGKINLCTRLITTENIRSMKFNKKYSIPNYLELNRRILAFTVFRLPHISDFISKSASPVDFKDQVFFKYIPIFSHLF